MLAVGIGDVVVIVLFDFAEAVAILPVFVVAAIVELAAILIAVLLEVREFMLVLALGLLEVLRVLVMGLVQADLVVAIFLGGALLVFSQSGGVFAALVAATGEGLAVGSVDGAVIPVVAGADAAGMDGAATRGAAADDEFGVAHANPCVRGCEGCKCGHQ